ncbi:MAG TPA: 50S ribosomal protein L14 [Candidatus Paceibacterota bacterium]|nr:50S ribosomal protein L14 [Candidatus Paceibacterota bacterium]
MIQPQTILRVVDNSGAKVIRCFRVLGGTRRRYAELGDMIVASVQIAEPRREIKKKAVVKAIVVRQKKAFRRKDGSYIRFNENAAILVNEKKEPIGNRIFGPIPREIRERGFSKAAGLAPELV